jgi:hypothetical protein
MALSRALALRLHAVLATVSRGCPPPQDKYLRVTHPSATDSRNCPCDLHVLSMPPAFALSQDQTLRFIPVPSHPDTKINQDPFLIQYPAPDHYQPRTRSIKRNVNASIDTPIARPQTAVQVLKTNPNPSQPTSHPPLQENSPRAPTAYPFLPDSLVKERSENRRRISHMRNTRQPCLKDSRHDAAQT